MKKTIWVLLDDRVGSNNMALGVLQYFSPQEFDIVEKNISYTKWARLPNIFKGRSLIGISSESRAQLSAPFPDMVIAATRRTATIAAWIGKQSNHKTKLFQLNYPTGSCFSDFDIIFVPEHDKNKKHSANMFFVAGSPNRTNEQSMSAARAKWLEQFQFLPRPWTTVIVGGSIKGKPFSLENAEALAEKIKEIKQKAGGSILITSSRRTGEAAQNRIMEMLNGIPAHTFLWGEKKENPYMGYLACADNILVSGDSVSMACEACGTGKPVYVFTGKNWLTPKLMRFVESLYEGGYAVSIDSPDWSVFEPKAKLNAAKIVAEKIKENLSI